MLDKQEHDSPACLAQWLADGCVSGIPTFYLELLFIFQPVLGCDQNYITLDCMG